MASFISYSVKCHIINGTKLYHRESGCIQYVQSLANILRYERIEMPIFGTVTHLGEYKTTQKYLQVKKISPCESFVVKDCACGVLEPPHRPSYIERILIFTVAESDPNSFPKLRV